MLSLSADPPDPVIEDAELDNFQGLSEGSEDQPAPPTPADEPGADGSSELPLHVVTPANGDTPLHFVWDAEQARALRQTHRLLGDLVGTLPRHMSQNQFLGLPLLLSPEEARHAVKNESIPVAPVHDDAAAYRAVPPQAAVRAFYGQRRADVERQATDAAERDAVKRAKHAAANGLCDEKKGAAKGEGEKPPPPPGSKEAKREEKRARREKRKAAARAAAEELRKESLRQSGGELPPPPPPPPPQQPAKPTRKRARSPSRTSDGMYAENGGVGADDARPTKARRVGFFERFTRGISTALRSVVVTLGLVEPVEIDADANGMVDVLEDHQETNGVLKEEPVSLDSGGDDVERVDGGGKIEPKEEEVPDLDMDNDVERADGGGEVEPKEEEVPGLDMDLDMVFEGDGDDDIGGAEGDGESRELMLYRKALTQGMKTAMVVQATQARKDELAGARHPAKVAPLPRGSSAQDRHARARQAVFDDLHARGYTLSGGSKFGSDLLAYAADPQLVHAALSVVVVEAREQVSARDIVALGRLGDSTRKRCVLAWPCWRRGDGDGVDDGGGGENEGDGVCEKVEYLGIQWDETLP